MGPKKGRRVMKRKFSLTVFLNLSWGTQWQISSGGEKRGRPDRGRGTTTATELGKGKEGGGKSRGITLTRGGTTRKRPRTESK